MAVPALSPQQLCSAGAACRSTGLFALDFGPAETGHIHAAWPSTPSSAGPGPRWPCCWELEENASAKGLWWFVLVWWFVFFFEAEGQQKPRGLILALQEPPVLLVAPSLPRVWAGPDKELQIRAVQCCSPSPELGPEAGGAGVARGQVAWHGARGLPEPWRGIRDLEGLRDA